MIMKIKQWENAISNLCLKLLRSSNQEQIGNGKIKGGGMRIVHQILINKPVRQSPLGT
jgi:hypothetical protein